MVHAHRTKSPLMFSSRFVCAVALASLMFAATSASTEESKHGTSASPANLKRLTDTSLVGFDWQYATTFAFDDCGYSDEGRQGRKLLIERMEACPFTEAAKKQFYVNAAKSGEAAMQDLITYVSVHHSMPTTTPGGIKGCSSVFANEGGSEFRKNLKLYGQGKIPASAFSDVADCMGPALQPGEALPPIPTYADQPSNEKR